jgi:hypothetical protein
VGPPIGISPAANATFRERRGRGKEDTKEERGEIEEGEEAEPKTRIADNVRETTSEMKALLLLLSSLLFFTLIISE